ncbi:MAG: hypothetical protein J6Y72_05640 [Bacteroidales bacterium]|nr:hypothetical protein [Bacteroidales bacterium]MCR5697150.1 hypothetical protein [Marinilabiliaceae bacterium]
MKTNFKMVVVMTIAILATANSNILAQNSARHNNQTVTRSANTSRQPAQHHNNVANNNRAQHAYNHSNSHKSHVHYNDYGHHKVVNNHHHHYAPAPAPVRVVHHYNYSDVRPMPVRHIVHNHYRYVVYDRFYAPDPYVVGAIYTQIPANAVCYVVDGRRYFSALGYTFCTLNIAGQLFYQLVN